MEVVCSVRMAYNDSALNFNASMYSFNDENHIHR